MAPRYERRDWEDFENEALAALYPIWTGEQLSRLFERSRSSIHQQAARLGLKAQPIPITPARATPNQVEPLDVIERIPTARGTKVVHRRPCGAIVTLHVMK